jgi:hypothetical protein
MTAREAERAGARLERMTRRRHGWLVAALALGMIAAVGALASGWLAATILVGGGGLLIMWLFVTLQRANLIHDLALEPQAYVVPDVRRFGAGLVVEPGRSRIAASLDHVLANAGKPGSYYLADRVDACRDQIRALALAFRAPAPVEGRRRSGPAVATREIRWQSPGSPNTFATFAVRLKANVALALLAGATVTLMRTATRQPRSPSAAPPATRR